jgi:hypothetical protein
MKPFDMTQGHFDSLDIQVFSCNELWQIKEVPALSERSESKWRWRESNPRPKDPKESIATKLVRLLFRPSAESRRKTSGQSHFYFGAHPKG